MEHEVKAFVRICLDQPLLAVCKMRQFTIRQRRESGNQEVDVMRKREKNLAGAGALVHSRVI